MKRIVCFHSDVDFGVTTHLAGARRLVPRPRGGKPVGDRVEGRSVELGNVAGRVQEQQHAVLNSDAAELGGVRVEDRVLLFLNTAGDIAELDAPAFDPITNRLSAAWPGYESTRTGKVSRHAEVNI